MTAAPPRRAFRFGLRTVFALVTLTCVWLGYSANWIRQRHAAAARSTSVSWYPTASEWRPYPAEPPATAPGLLWLLDEPAVSEIDLTQLPADTDVQWLKSLFPEATLYDGSAHF